MKSYKHDAGHMTKMAAMSIYGKNPSKILSRTGRPISTKHRGLQPIKVCSNDDPGVTLTYFTAKVKFGNLDFSMGKSENSGFFRNYCAASYLKANRSSHPN